MEPPLGSPPGPIGWPLLGCLPQYLRNPAGFLLSVALEYGDISSFRLGTRKVYLLNRPDLIEEVLVTGQRNFVKSPVLQRAKVLLGEGLLTSEGALHMRQRKMLQPAFYRDRLTSYATTMVECAVRARERWAPGSVLAMDEEMMRVTLAVVGLTLFSRDVESDAKEIGQALTDVLATFSLTLLPFSEYLLHLPFGRMKRAAAAQKLLDAKIYEIIAERRNSGIDHGDLLSTLLLAAEDGEGQMSDRQVRDEALTLILAGHETTANALTWTWYLLSQHPHVEDALRQEWAEVLGGRNPGFSDLPSLPCTERVLAESMRLYPPAWAIGRMALNQFRLYNYMIRPGAICLMSPYAMHRNPRFWPNPEVFDPDRFLPEEKATRPKLAYMPFGAGPRICIGERFAWMEGVLLLATIGQHWRFRLCPGQVVDVHPQVTLRPRGGIRMVADRVVV